MTKSFTKAAISANIMFIKKRRIQLIHLIRPSVPGLSALKIRRTHIFDKCRKGLTYSGETSLFTFQPPLNTDGEYLDFIIKFHDNSIIDKIAVIYIEVYRQHNNGNITQIYSQYYKPQAGINAFRLKNYFSQNLFSKS